jgi:hypothetical protein
MAKLWKPLGTAAILFFKGSAVKPAAVEKLLDLSVIHA